jgi:hypothetical protein
VVTATASDNESVALVEFFVNRTNRIGQATASPYTATFRDAPESRHLLTAVATDSAGLQSTSPPVAVTVGNPSTNVLFVVGNTTLNAGDTAVYNLLTGKGANVDVVSGPASATEQADGKALVVVSSTITSGDVGAKFRDVAVPVLQWEQANQDDYRMTLDAGTDRGTLAGQSQINIINDTHPLAAGLPAGITDVTTSAQTFSWGVPQGDVTIIATIATNRAWSCLYGYEGGAAMLDGFVAPDRRVMVFLENATAGALTSTGARLVSAAIDWALNLGQGAASPILFNPQKSGDTFSVSVMTESGRTYLLQSKDALSDPIWVTVQTVPGTGGTVTLTDLNATAATRFYRVEVQ